MQIFVKFETMYNTFAQRYKRRIYRDNLTRTNLNVILLLFRLNKIMAKQVHMILVVDKVSHVVLSSPGAFY